MRTQKRRIAEESPNCCKLGVQCMQNVFLVLSYRKEQVRTMIKFSKVAKTKRTEYGRECRKACEADISVPWPEG